MCLDCLIVFQVVFQLGCFWFRLGSCWFWLVVFGCVGCLGSSCCFLLRSDVEACVSLCEFVFICFRLLYVLEVLQIASSCLRFFGSSFFGCLNCVGWMV